MNKVGPSIKGAMRRATILVRNMDRSLAFYGGALGLTIYAKVEVDLTKVPFFPIGIEPRGGNGQLCILKGADPLIGMVGLLELREPPLPEPPHDMRRLGIGSVALVLSVSDADAAVKAVEKLGGSILMPATIARNLGDKAGNFVPVKLFMAQDPDGYFLEIFEPTAN